MAAAIVGFKLPEGYLASAETWGVYVRGELVGGYSLVYDTKMRCLNFFSETERSSLDLIGDVKDSKIVEVTGVWLDGSIRTSKKHSTIMWSHMARRLVAARKSHVIFGFNTKEEKLANLYSQCNPATLYRGDSTNLQNQSGTHGSLCIQVVEIKPAVYAILKGIVRRSSLGAALGVRGLLYSNKKSI